MKKVDTPDIEIELRPFIWQQFKQFMNDAVEIQLGEDEPFVIYNSLKMSQMVTRIMDKIKVEVTKEGIKSK